MKLPCHRSVFEDDLDRQSASVEAAEVLPMAQLAELELVAAVVT